MISRFGYILRRAAAAGLCALAGCALAGCQPAPAPVAAAEPTAFDGVGYLVFNAPIVASSRDLFVADIDKLRSSGATEIHLGINSPGGDIFAARSIVDYMNRLHSQDGVTFKAYNVGLVASAATYVFLNAQDRYSAPNGTFLFHAAALVASGPVTSQNLRDSADKLDEYERIVRATLRSRTHLSDAEALTYVRRTVVLNSDDARRDGVVDGIAAFTVPKGARSWVIAVRPNPAAKPAAAGPPQG